MLTVEYANNPVYANEEGSAINLMVKFVEMTDILPFTATPNDSEEYGRQLYADAVAGKYGAVGPYVPPAQPSTEGTQTL
jgi:hypothetical protein